MEDLRIGVYFCWCGSNIADIIDIKRLAKEISEIPEVVVSKDYKYLCSDPGQDLILKDIKAHNLNRVVVASCSPRMHEITFQKVLANAGLNSYLFEMANIREHCSWVHTDKNLATKKAFALIKASIERVKFHKPLEKREVEVNQATLVIGGGVTGLTASLEIASAGKKVYLVEKNDKLGGNIANFDLTYPYMDSAKELVQVLIAKAKNDSNIEIFTSTMVEEISGFVGNFKGKIKHKSIETEIEIGNIIVATGYKPFDAEKIEQYGYKKFDRVITSVDLEKLLHDGIFLEKFPNLKNIVIINCVGSLSQLTHEYCSRTCCLTSLKQALTIKNLYAKTNVYIAYSDIRAFGKGCEEFYEKACKEDIRFALFDKTKMPRVNFSLNKLTVEMEEILTQTEIEIPADLVILSVGQESREDSTEIARLVGISQGRDGWFIEKHPKLDPVATTTDGVFIAGCCQGPKDISDSVAQALAATARVLSTITKGKYAVETITSEVNEEICAGCQTCISVCPYGAVYFNEEENVSVVNEVLCKGCGTCTSTCPAGAITSKHFTRQQILSQIEGLLTILEEVKN